MNQGPWRPEPGSFRDPLSRVFLAGDDVYRALTEGGVADFEALAATRFFPELMAEAKIVATERLTTVPDRLEGEWAGVLRHPRLAVISYPFEWSFEMLRDAALLQLEITGRAVAEGLITKDATSYNIQFDGPRPVFIDVGSFERPPAGEPWPGYRQFCELFLNPLVVQAVAGIPFQPWLRGAIDGISPSEVAPLVRGRHRLDRRLLVHVGLHARAERRFADSDAEHDVRADLRQAGFGPKVVAAQVANLEAAVRSLRYGDQESTWSDYTDRAHYDDADLAAKEAVVEAAVRERPPELVLDLGANDGHFSVLAAERGARRVVAVDSDHVVIDRLYRRLNQTGERRVLPLVLDLTNPSPGLGWRSQERRSFRDRIRPDLVLCLAVVHHLALTNAVPLDLIVDFLADFDAPVVVEFPLPEDPMAARLLARKRGGLFDHYGEQGWEASLARRFHVEQRVPLPSGRRVLYRCAPR